MAESSNARSKKRNLQDRGEESPDEDAESQQSEFDPFALSDKESDNETLSNDTRESASPEVVFVDETQVRKDKQRALQERAPKQQRRAHKSAKATQKGKGKASDIQSSKAVITPAKRGRPTRKKQAYMSSPITPSPLSSIVSTPAAARNSGDRAADDDNESTVDRRKKQRSKVWDHFTLMSEHGDGYGLFKCHGCEEEQISARLNSTSNLWTHARQSCPKVHALLTGVAADATQSRMDGINAVIPPFTKARLDHKIVEWIASSGLPFTTVESSPLRDLCKFLHQYAILPSADTVARHLEQLYEDTEKMVDERLQNNTFEYKEVLLRLVHLKGKHAGIRLGDGLFEIFQKMEIAHNVGPGTSDNASNNLTTAERLSERMNGELMLDMPSTDLLRCMCHVASLAATDYMDAEAKLESNDYQYNPANVPPIRIIGQDDFHSVDPTEEVIATADRAEREDEEEALVLGEGFDSSVTSEVDDSDYWVSPIVLAHSLGVFVHASPARMEIFETMRKDRDPTTRTGTLPMKDVPTRWNSREAAVQRILKFRATIKVFCIRFKCERCPQLGNDTFRVLELIQPALAVFRHLTMTYSEATASIHLAIGDLHDSITELRKMHDHVSLTEARQTSYNQAISKLEKYFSLLLKDNWACPAFALDLMNRAAGLQRLFETYAAAFDDPSLKLRFDEVEKWVQKRVTKYETNAPPSSGPTTESTCNSAAWRKNVFATRTPSQNDLSTQENAWSIYNDDSRRFEAALDKKVLPYWQRQHSNRMMRSLACVARDVLGMAPSTTSVERLFSQSGFVFGKRRGSLSPRMLVKQTSLKVWRSQGLIAKC
ncbi:hypothetical protein QFC21_007195 [Naganishia friedmannii]|uniref:Uncharacterized protein n=1 Tax=Naganishia friedmannii TaxID=89922 RepID=A0ACC2UWP2_9TREE|nr:hypothetical protein QFC21_007195 [Naganishia friedmannii]